MRTALLLTLAAIALGVPQARAQVAGGGAADAAHHTLGAGFGQVFLLGGNDSTFQNHIGFDLLYGFEQGPTYGLLVQFHLSSHSDALNPNDSLSFKGLTPNLKFNIVHRGQFVLSAFAGMGAYLVDENLNGQSSSFFLFAMDAGIYPYADLGPHFRVGPSLSFIYIAAGTNYPDSTATSPTAGTPMSAGGNNIELMFNLTYIF
jgi:hypothetical protein